MGGAIFNNGMLTVADSKISNNTAIPETNNTDSGIGIGGGIGNFNYGITTIINSTFTGNNANSGGGLLSFSGIGDFANQVTVINSIFEGNTAVYNGGAIGANANEFSITNSTLVNNTANNDSGDAIYGTPVTLQNTIIANDNPNDDVAVFGDVTANGANIVADNSLTGANILNADPMLDTDLVPLPGSPAIDAADSSLLPADEFDIDNDGDTTEPLPLDVDGDPRIQGSNLDIGAQESSFTFDLVSDGITPSDAIFVINRIGEAVTNGRNAVADRDNDEDIDEDDVDLIIDAIGTPAN